MDFTIVTPSYRQPDWLKLCCGSIADQQGTSFEHIIQDNHSGPEVEETVAPFPQSKLCVENDTGMYDAINRGLRKGTGEICAYLNCDEQYLPGTLQKVFRFFHENPRTDLLFGDAIILDAHVQPIAYRRVLPPWPWHVRTCNMTNLTCATFFRRRLLDQGHFFDPSYRAIGDAAWMLRMLQESVPMAAMHEPLACFTLTDQNLHASPAAQEITQWQSSAPFLPKIFKPLTILVDRLRRAAAGAYATHTPELSLITPETFPNRKKLPKIPLKGTWPSLPH